MNRFKLLKLLKKIYTGQKPDLNEVEKMGILAIKICQYYALRIDFLNEEVCLHLSKLYENSYAETKKSLYSLIGSDKYILDKFSKYDTEPFASASIGQVHMGVLKKDLQDVVIKILRRDGERAFKNDVKNAKQIINILLFFYPKLKKVFNPMEALEYIEMTTLKELNFLNEVKGANFFIDLKNKNKNQFDLEKLKFSEFYEDLCTERVVVSKYIRGDSFNKLLSNGGLKYETLLELFKYHSFYMFKLGTFHGDIHPGNIILDTEGNINLIDCSTIGEINEKLRYGLFWFFYYLSRYDYENAGKFLNKMSEVELKNEKYNIFIEKFKNLYSDFKNKNVSEISLTRRMMETIKLGVNCGMNFPHGMFHVIKSMMYLDGMVLKCNPKAILMNDVREFTNLLEKELALS